MNTVLAMPWELRIAVLALAGAWAGSAVNWATYRLAWNPRPISPFGPKPVGGPARWIGDCIPILGWLSLRREASLHGCGFWIRPMIIEAILAAGQVYVIVSGGFDLSVGSTITLTVIGSSMLLNNNPDATWWVILVMYAIGLSV
ncbi:MAG: hypothetical protein U1E05_16180, partial [Patescibacteria group bacterium]|nr:hypothetical protein [Patescibacteria group bacterium]